MLDGILDNIPCGIMLLDSRLTVCTINRALQEMTGYSTDEARGIDAESILRSNVGAGRILAKEVLASGESVRSKGTILNRKRLILPVLFTLGRVDDCGSGEQGVVVVAEAATHLEAGREGQGKFALIGHSPKMLDVFERMEILARTDASVLITGETGCGKDNIAEELHNASERRRQPFIKVNCGALPESLLESELFGHKRGAFTGAVKDHPGMFRMADKGTLFLTEIGDLSLPLQVKLLSVLDDRQFFPVGSTAKVSVDVRVIAATHRDLRSEVAAGLFREDLFYRLNVLHLHVPPLREREGDIRVLLDHFLRRSLHVDGVVIREFDQEALDVLGCYSWPGNVRELRNVVEYAVHMCRGEKIGRKDLPEYLFKPFENVKEKESFTALPVQEQIPAFLPASNWTELEKQRILRALEHARGRKGEAAKLLSMGRTTLWRKMKQYGLE